VLKRGLWLSLSLAIVAAAVAPALTYVPINDGELADQADLIVRVSLAAAEVTAASGRVTTDYEATVLEIIKGESGGSRLLVRVPGGVASQGNLRVWIHGIPAYNRGDNALLFLQRNPDGSYRILHLVQGAFKEEVHGGRRVLERDLTEAFEIVLDGSGNATFRPGQELVRDALEFETWRADRVRGVNRPADYFTSVPEIESQDELAGSGKFTVLASPNITARWFRFDRGKRLRWFRHAEGQPGLAKGGAAEFRKARKAWNRTGTPIRLTNGGTTDSAGGFRRLDGRNTILFDDLNDTIGDDFDCSTGGILAIGGFSDFGSLPRTWKQIAAVEAFEAEIVVNRGVDCFVAGRPKVAAQIYTHELGHTLGLGHSCGDFSSPDCDDSELLSDAVMRASLANVVGARLNDDDLAGARLLYDPEFYAAPCETQVPGSPKFCRQCGPCGVGQGNCRNDSDCFDLLVCDKNAGAVFGFDSSTNVCVEPDFF
jgi:hypothetical protein